MPPIVKLLLHFQRGYLVFVCSNVDQTAVQKGSYTQVVCDGIFIKEAIQRIEGHHFHLLSCRLKILSDEDGHHE